MLQHVREKLDKDAGQLADQLETTFGSPRKIEVYEVMDGYGIRLTWKRMGFGSGKTYIVTLTLDDGGF
jgi:hypothetical protein